MSKVRFFTGLDIGSHSIKGICVAKRPESEEYEVYAKTDIVSFGIRKGVVENPQKVTEKIKLLIRELSQMTGEKIEDVCININGSHIFAKQSRGTVAISRADDQISKEDVNRVIQAATAISLANNKEVLKVFPSEFVVDDQSDIKDPVGMKGTRLETEITALCAFAPYKRYLANAVLDADLQINDIIPSPIAAARAVLTPEQKELGVALLDLGAGTTGLAVYEEGKMIHSCIFPVGSSNITNDIAIGMRTSIDEAEKIKKNFSLKGRAKKEPKARKKNQDESNNIEMEKIIFNYRELHSIVAARLSEIFKSVNEELKKIQKQGKLPAGIIITGGGAKIPGIVDFARKELKLPAQIGRVLSFTNIEDDPTFGTLCGLVICNSELEGEEPQNRGNFWSKVKRFFKSFIP